jgi:RecJ-like exonuclease
MAEILSSTKFKCAFCGGTGIQPRSFKSRCLTCRGKGEIEFEGPAVQCSSCKGTGKTSNSFTLSCLSCKGAGAIEKVKSKSDVGDIVGERLGEITKRLQWMRKETEKKTEEIEQKLEPIKPLIKELKKETVWLEKLKNKAKKILGFDLKD